MLGSVNLIVGTMLNNARYVIQCEKDRQTLPHSCFVSEGEAGHYVGEKQISGTFFGLHWRTSDSIYSRNSVSTVDTVEYRKERFNKMKGLAKQLRGVDLSGMTISEESASVLQKFAKALSQTADSHIQQKETASAGRTSHGIVLP